MSYLVLARKWRPQNFDEVVGQEALTQTIKNAIKMGRVPHALLFSGPRGVGKTTMARLLAKALNCDTGPTEKPCDKCSSCRQIMQGNAMDVLEIDGASNTGVDDVRQLRESVQYRPSSSRYKVYIIDEVHMLSRGAFNALLKTLEEPPDHVFFIFATTEPHKVPQTIQSRCQRFDFRRIPPPVIISRLKKIADAEGIKVSEKGLRILARQAEGSMRDAISILDQAVSFSGKTVADEKLSELLATVDRKHLFEMSEALVRANPKNALEILDAIYQHGYDLNQFHKELIDHFRDLMVVKFVEEPAGLVELSEDELAELKKQANLASEEAMSLIFEFLLQAEERLARSEYPKVVLEFALVKAASVKPMLKVEELIARLEELKKEIASGKVSAGKDDFELEGGPEPSRASGSGASGAAPTESKTEFSPEPKSWKGFLVFLAQNWPSMATILKNGEFKGKENGKITVAFSDEFCRKFFNDPSRINEANKCLNEYFAESLSLVCVEKKGREEKPSEAPSGMDKAALRKKLVEHPLLQKAVEIFSATVEEVKVK